jgi:hypothetical protein
VSATSQACACGSAGGAFGVGSFVRLRRGLRDARGPAAAPVTPAAKGVPALPWAEQAHGNPARGPLAIPRAGGLRLSGPEHGASE